MLLAVGGATNSIKYWPPLGFTWSARTSRVLEFPCVARDTATFSVRLDIRGGHPAENSTELRNKRGFHAPPTGFHRRQMPFGVSSELSQGVLGRLNAMLILMH